MRKILLVFLVGLYWISRPRIAFASSCSVSVTPGYVLENSFVDFGFQINNTSAGDTYKWVKFSITVDDIDLNNPTADTWIATGDRSQGTFINTSGIGPGLSQVFNFTQSGVGPAPASVVVTAQAATSEDGTGASECGTSTINIVTQIVGAPVISNINLAVGNSSATLTWNTDLSSTGSVNYGTSSAYGQNVSTANSTSHSVTMSNLSSSTTYHYQIAATGTGGTTTTADATFNTSAASVTTTVTTTVTNTVSQTVTKIITDTTPPSIKIGELGKKVYESAPVISGSATDDRGVAKIEYRVKDRETSWSNASLTGEVGAKKTEWEFLPPISLDDTYTIEVRGVDVFGNVSVAKTVEFVIDQLPPTVGGGVISYGALPLFAKDGVVEVVAGLQYEVVLYENGGADSVELQIANQKFSMNLMGESGLWRGLIKFDERGEFVSKVRATDGAGNTTEREWVKFRVMPKGRILQNGVELKDAMIKVFWLDPTTKIYQEWDASEYGIKVGGMGVVLPKGEYYFQTEVGGQKIISQKISLDNTTTINGDWEVGKGKWWEKLLRVRRLASIPVSQYSDPQLKPSLAVGRESWIGKKSVVVIGTQNLPWFSESKRRAEEWAKQEGAQLVLLEEQGENDPKGEWLEKLRVGLLPQVYLVNDKGDTVDYKEGIWER